MLRSVFSKFPNELKQRDIVAAHKMKSKLFKEDYIGVSIHKTELANCRSRSSTCEFAGPRFRDQIPNY